MSSTSSDEASVRSQARHASLQRIFGWQRLNLSYRQELGVVLRSDGIASADLSIDAVAAGRNLASIEPDWWYVLTQDSEGRWYCRVGGQVTADGAQDELGPFPSQSEALRAVAERLLAYLVLATNGQDEPHELGEFRLADEYIPGVADETWWSNEEQWLDRLYMLQNGEGLW